MTYRVLRIQAAAALVAAVVSGGVSVAHADVAGYSSDATRVVVGPSLGGFHGAADLPGVGFPPILGGGVIPLADIALMVGGYADGIASMGSISATEGIIFSRVVDPLAEVYYGEYSDIASAPNDAKHSVFFVGKDPTAGTAHLSGTATYQVFGINNYAYDGERLGAPGVDHMGRPVLFAAQFAVDFDTNQLSGNLERLTHANTAGVTDILSINATIDSSNASFAGTAVANGIHNGSTQGQLFGPDASSLAGVAEFTDRNLDTAYGGER